jgi:hypothetical protein
MTVIDEIAAERRRQIEAEGWAPEHDDCHNRGELALAAATYCLHTVGGISLVPYGDIEDNENVGPNVYWPWTASCWKPKDRRRDLIRAAALIVAEIERLDRAKEIKP